MTDSSEAEKAWEEYWKGKYGLKFEHIYDNSIERETWLAAWSACAEKAAGVADDSAAKEQKLMDKHKDSYQGEVWKQNQIWEFQALRDKAADIAAEIRRRLGGKA